MPVCGYTRNEEPLETGNMHGSKSGSPVYKALERAEKASEILDRPVSAFKHGDKVGVSFGVIDGEHWGVSNETSDEDYHELLEDLREEQSVNRNSLDNLGPRSPNDPAYKPENVVSGEEIAP